MNQSIQPLTLATCLLCISSISNIFIQTSAQANPSPPKIVAVEYIPPPPPPNRGSPGHRSEGGSRGGFCDGGESNQTLEALVPVYDDTVSHNQPISMTQVWGLTSNRDPTFWFFVPYSGSSIKAIEFVLRNEQDKTIYRQPVTIPRIPGIVNFHLRSSNATLELGKNYHWFFNVQVACEALKPTEVVDSVDGWVQLTNLNSSLSASIEQATSLRKVALYAENGIWFDALTTLAELRSSHSKDATLTAEWTSLLKSVGLENLAAEPLVK